MASPIAHIVYAKDFLNSVQCSFSQEWRNEFIAGSLFPDIIRLLPHTSRELTHNRYPVDLNFSALSPFYAGWKFHLYCDKAREYFLKKENFYDIPHSKDCSYAANKFLEDMLIYERFDKYEDLSNFLCLFDLSVDGVDRNTIRPWYQSISEYVRKKPNFADIEVILERFKTPDNDIEAALQSVRVLKSDKRAVTLLGLVSNNIMLLQQEKELPLQLL